MHTSSLLYDLEPLPDLRMILWFERYAHLAFYRYFWCRSRFFSRPAAGMRYVNSRGYGPGRKYTFQEYHAVPRGWDFGAVLSAHSLLKGTFDIYPHQVRAGAGDWWLYHQTLCNIADGIRAGDSACVELAIRFIEARFFVSYSGYMRSRFATRLRKAVLSENQKHRLSSHFMGLVEAGEICYEFGDFARLWRRCIAEAHLEALQELSRRGRPLQAKIAKFALQKIAPHEGTRPAAQEPGGG